MGTLDLFTDADVDPRAGRRRRGSGRGASSKRQDPPAVRLAKWIPTVLALGLFAQLCLGGLRPALEERARLERVADRLVDRRAQLMTDANELERLRAAQNDPVYRERLRRRGLDPRFGPQLEATGR